MNRLYISYIETHSGGEAISDEAWSSRNDLIIDTTITRVSLSKPDTHYYHTIDLIENEFHPGDAVHLLTVRYSDGDTFGSSYGHLHVEDAYRSFVEAATEMKLLEQDNKDRQNGNWDKNNTKKYKSAVWKGYFNHLDRVDVESFTVFP